MQDKLRAKVDFGKRSLFCQFLSVLLIFFILFFVIYILYLFLLSMYFFKSSTINLLGVEVQGIFEQRILQFGVNSAAAINFFY